jgi:hypothetical protein
MSISAMKQALDDICGAKLCEINSMSSRAEMIRLMDKAITALHQAIAEAEKQEPVLFFIQYKHRHEILWSKPKWVQEGVLEIKPFYAAPVHASDISQERVDETAKDRHEPVAWREVAGKTTHYYDYNEQGRGEPLYAAPQPDLARVGEVGVWGDKREWVGLDDDIPGLGLVTEEFYNGMLCAEDILRKRNT